MSNIFIKVVVLHRLLLSAIRNMTIEPIVKFLMMVLQAKHMSTDNRNKEIGHTRMF